MAKQEITAEELIARAESNSYKRGAHREKDSIRDENRHTNKDQEGSKCGVRPLRPARDQYLAAVTKISAGTS
jgi:hypothetical protein